jgi:hypothetical protein
VLHGERLSVEVSRQQSLRMLRCHQVNRNEIWIRIPVGVEIDGRFEVGPLGMGDWRISVQEIIESQTEPRCDCAPPLHTDETGNLVMDPVAGQKSFDAERNGQAGGRPSRVRRHPGI